MKHGVWLATLWLAGCCCLRAHPPTQPAGDEPSAAAVAEPAVIDAAPAVAAATAPEVTVAAAAPAEPAVEPPAQPSRPSQTEQGKWAVVAASERQEQHTQALAKRLGDAGFQVTIVPVKIGDATWYRVVLPGYRDKGDAGAALSLVNEAAGIKDAWVWRRAKEAAAN